MVALKTKLLFLVVVSYHTLVKLRPILALAPREAISFFHLLDTWSDFLKWFIDACRQLLLISKQPASRRVWTLLVRMLAGRTCLLRLCRWIHCWGGGAHGTNADLSEQILLLFHKKKQTRKTYHHCFSLLIVTYEGKIQSFTNLLCDIMRSKTQIRWYLISKGVASAVIWPSLLFLMGYKKRTIYCHNAPSV